MGWRYSSEQLKRERLILKKFAFLFFLSISICLYWIVSSQREKNSFEYVFVTKLTEIRVPCIEVEVENRTVTAEFDLGFSGFVKLSKNFLEKIKNKKFKTSDYSYGIRGKKYEIKVYEIPSIQIGSKKFLNLEVDERSDEFNYDAILDHSESPQKFEECTLGWKLFRDTNLFFNLRKGEIAFCEDLSILENQGYDLSRFSSAPLILERGVIELEIETNVGPLRCMLDTGATRNFLNTPLKEGQSLEQAYTGPEEYVETPFLRINGIDLGPAKFLPIPLNLPIYIDAILGMDFFVRNFIYLDFKNQKAYFCPRDPEI